MIPGRVLLVAVLAIAVTFEQAGALKCRVCDSRNDANCLDSPDKIEATDCVAPTEPPEVTTPGKPAEVTTPGKPAEVTTPGKPAEVTTPGKPAEVTTPGKPAEVTTPAKPAEVKTSAKPAEVTTSAKPAEVKTTAKPAEVTTSAKPAEVTTSAKPAEVTTSAKPATGNEGGANEQEENNPDGYGNEVPKVAAESLESPEYPSVINRFRRGVFLRDEASFVCFKLVYKEGDKDVVERGCAPKSDDTCQKLKEPEAKKDAECFVCDDKDGCNASTRISLGLTSILIPAAIVMFLRL